MSQEKFSYPQEYEEYFKFLDDLRESGVTNMFGAQPYLQAAYPELVECRTIIMSWMKTFAQRHGTSNEQPLKRV